MPKELIEASLEKIDQTHQTSRAKLPSSIHSNKETLANVKTSENLEDPADAGQNPSQKPGQKSDQKSDQKIAKNLAKNP